MKNTLLEDSNQLEVLLAMLRPCLPEGVDEENIQSIKLSHGPDNSPSIDISLTIPVKALQVTVKPPEREALIACHDDEL